MSSEVPWKRTFRRATALWTVISAMSGPLVSGYHILSSRGHLPPAPDHAGVLTVVVNTCILTGGMLLIAGLSSVSFVFLAGRDGFWITILKPLLLAPMGYLFLVSTLKYGAVVGALMLAAALCAITPAAKYVDKYESEIMAGSMILLVAAFLIYPDMMQDCWTTITQQSDYRLIPLAAMNLADWLYAVLGAIIYVQAYIEFQRWRTDGKWLEETKKRLDGDP